MDKKKYELFKKIMADVLMPIIEDDKDIIHFFKKNGISSKDEQAAIKLWLACATIASACEDKDNDLSEAFYDAAVGMQQDMLDKLSDSFDDIEDILDEILEDNLEEWVGKVNKALGQDDEEEPEEEESEEEEEEPKPTKVRGKTTKITVSKKDADLGRKFALVMHKKLSAIVAKEEDVIELAEKYPKLGEEKIISYTAAFALLVILQSMGESDTDKGHKLKETPYFAFAIVYLDKMVDTQTAEVKSVIKNYKQWTHDFTEVMDDHLEEFNKKYIKAFNAMFEKNKK